MQQEEDKGDCKEREGEGMNRTTSVENIEKVRKNADRLNKLGVPARITDKIGRWANDEARRLRDEPQK